RGGRRGAARGGAACREWFRRREPRRAAAGPEGRLRTPRARGVGRAARASRAKITDSRDRCAMGSNVGAKGTDRTLDGTFQVLLTCDGFSNCTGGGFACPLRPRTRLRVCSRLATSCQTVPFRRGESMPMRKLWLGLAGLALLVSAGCAGKANVQTRKRADFDKKLDRVLIVFAPERLGDDFVVAFRPRFAKQLQSRGVESQYAIVEGELTLETAPSLSEQAKEFQATSILSLLAAGGTLNSNGSVATARLNGKLMDLGLRKLVWRADIEYTPGGTLVSVEERADVLVRAILDALVADGLISEQPKA